MKIAVLKTLICRDYILTKKFIFSDDFLCCFQSTEERKIREVSSYNISSVILLFNPISSSN